MTDLFHEPTDTDPALLDQLTDAAPSIAKSLGDSWSVQPTPAYPDPATAHSVPLGHTSGISITLHVDTYIASNGRLIAEGRLPDLPDDVIRNEVDTTSLNTGHTTMTPDKVTKPQQMARQITRRLLPTLTTAHKEWTAKVEAARAKESHRRRAADLIATVPGINSPHRNQSTRNYQHAYLLDWDGEDRLPGYTRSLHNHCVPKVRVTADANQATETVHIELRNLSAEAARAAVAAAIAASRVGPSHPSQSTAARNAGLAYHPKKESHA
jgi:hypothetical protein